MGWTVEFHEKAYEEFTGLSKQARERITSTLDKIEDVGIELLPAKLSKYIENGIWELRTTSQDGIARSLYVTKANKTLKILVVFAKKTPKTPRHEIELAQKRRYE